MITCPSCHKPIEDDDALLCLYCGASLGRRIGFIGSWTKRFLLGLTLLVLGAFLILLLR